MHLIMIEVNNITKRFGGVTAVDGVSFKVDKGEVVGFLGPNGAGKSTTMRILTCFLPADLGTARVAGFDVHDDSLDVRSRVGYLPESAPLYPDMNVLDFLGYIARIRGIPSNKRRSSIDKMVEVTGLKSELLKDIRELSKGYRQRVGLAQAMIHDPDIMILDEPTSGLDPNQIREIRSLIKDLGQEKTVILSTHILPEVEATCSRAIIINNGRIIEDGSIDEITRRARSGDSHRIRIRGERQAIEAKLGSMTDVREYRLLEEEGGLLMYDVFGNEGLDLGEDLFRMSADAGFSLSELYREKTSLEDVFTQLTSGDKS